METKRIKFTKFSGRSLFSVQKSYLMEDHLLVVDGYYTESYKRLYYKDIEAVLVCPTASGMVFACIWAFISVCMFLPLLRNGFSVGYLTLAFFGMFPAIFAGVLFYGGGSARFGIQTAVQTVLLDGIRSRRKARKVKQRLVEKVESVQGVLTESDLRAALQEPVASMNNTSRAVANDLPPQPETIPFKPETKLKLKNPEGTSNT